VHSNEAAGNRQLTAEETVCNSIEPPVVEMKTELPSRLLQLCAAQFNW
jgi:hypothetical protein